MKLYYMLDSFFCMGNMTFCVFALIVGVLLFVIAGYLTYGAFSLTFLSYHNGMVKGISEFFQNFNASLRCCKTPFVVAISAGTVSLWVISLFICCLYARFMVIAFILNIFAISILELIGSFIELSWLFVTGHEIANWLLVALIYFMIKSAPKKIHQEKKKLLNKIIKN